MERKFNRFASNTFSSKDASITSDLVIEGQLDMEGDRIINVGTGTSSTDAVNKAQMDAADALNVLKAGDTMTGPLIVDTLNNNSSQRWGIEGGINSPVQIFGATNIVNIRGTRNSVVGQVQLNGGSTIFYGLNGLVNFSVYNDTLDLASRSKIINMVDGTAPQHAVSKSQMETAIAAVAIDNYRIRGGTINDSSGTTETRIATWSTVQESSAHVSETSGEFTINTAGVYSIGWTGYFTRTGTETVDTGSTVAMRLDSGSGYNRVQRTSNHYTGTTAALQTIATFAFNLTMTLAVNDKIDFTVQSGSVDVVRVSSADSDLSITRLSA